MNTVASAFHQKLLLIVIALSILMENLDGSIVNVAMPAMAVNFNTDTGTMAWVSITYFLMMSGLLIVFGKLAEYGYIRKVFIGGMIIFLAGSVLCGISPELVALLGSRIVQGLGAAMLAAAAPLLCILYLPGKMLGLGLGVVTMASSIGCAAGPALGGLLMLYLSWHWIFLINIPIGILVVPFALMVVPKSGVVERKSFDYAGALFLFAMMTFGICALEYLPHLGILHPWVLICIGLTGLFGVLFVRRERSCKTPILSIRVFSNWKFNAVLAAYFIINIVYTGVLYLLPYYLTTNMKFTPMTIGLFLLIPPILTAVLGVPIGKWSDRVGRRYFSIAACLALVAFNVVFAITLPDMGVISLVLTLVLMGLVWGLAGGTASSRIVENVSEEDKGTGSSLMVTSIYFGGGVGTALYTMFFLLAVSPHGEIVAFDALSPELVSSGFGFAILIGLIFAVLSVIFSVIVRDQKSSGVK